MFFIKKIYNYILTFLLIMCLIGCQNNAKKQGSFTDITYDAMVEKLDKKDTFILQFTKKTCPYCIKLEKIEADYLLNHNVDIFRFYVDLNENDYKNNLNFLNSIFEDINFVPTVYWIEKGKPMNQLPILEEDQYEVLEEWIADNELYY